MARKEARNGAKRQKATRNGAGTANIAGPGDIQGPRSVTDEAADAILEAVQQLRACTARVQTMLSAPGKKYDERLASHLSWLAKNMAANLDALRKQEAAARKRLESTTFEEELELVKDWYDEAPEETRSALRVFVAQENRGILS